MSMLEEEENINAIRQLTEQFDEVTHDSRVLVTNLSHTKPILI